MTTLAQEKAALVIAHPGHELCVHGWLETARPVVFVLTDGSGRTGASRLASTTSILNRAGARSGSIYGRFTDQNIYEAILDWDFHFFQQLVVELAQALVEADVDYVAGDAMEGYNSIHDACRLVTNGAVDLCNSTNGRKLINRDFLLYAGHHTIHEQADVIRLALDSGQFARKIEMARAYPELLGDIGAMLDNTSLETLNASPELSKLFSDAVTDNMGSEAYRVECLRQITNPATVNGSENEVPFYQKYGEHLVASGIYSRAISYRDHIVPLAESIRSFVEATR